MPQPDYSPVISDLEEEYKHYAPRSHQLQERACLVMVDGGSHGRRLNRPFPPRITRASGAWLIDQDGHRILDYWQGHFANLLGHNAPFLTEILAEGFKNGFGLQTGFTDELQIEVAEILCKQTGAEKVRFTTSGTLGTMYATLLGRAYTGRDLVMKIGGGFHGAQPWGLKGIHYKTQKSGYNHPEGEGVPGDLIENILLTPYNDPQTLEEQFRQHGNRIACLIMEPVLGAGGLITSSIEFMQAARRLTQQYGALLILDEVISGFRFRAGDLGSVYGVQPDLAIFGKVIGGGMPFAAVAGRTDVLNLVGKASGNRVQFSGGTYSAHPATMLATKTLLEHVILNEGKIYPHLAKMGEAMRQTMEAVFHSAGILAKSTGELPAGLGGSSMAAVHFPYHPDIKITQPGIASDPETCDVQLRTEVLPLALILEDTHIIAGHGCLTTAHGEDEQAYFKHALENAVQRIKRSLD